MVKSSVQHSSFFFEVKLYPRHSQTILDLVPRRSRSYKSRNPSFSQLHLSVKGMYHVYKILQSKKCSFILKRLQNRSLIQTVQVFKGCLFSVIIACCSSGKMVFGDSKRESRSFSSSPSFFCFLWRNLMLISNPLATLLVKDHIPILTVVLHHHE